MTAIKSKEHLRQLDSQHKHRNKVRMNKSGVPLPCETDKGKNKELRYYIVPTEEEMVFGEDDK